MPSVSNTFTMSVCISVDLFMIDMCLISWITYQLNACFICDFSFEKSPRHDAYVPKFEAELAQFCEKLVGFEFILVLHG